MQIWTVCETFYEQALNDELVQARARAMGQLSVAKLLFLQLFFFPLILTDPISAAHEEVFPEGERLARASRRAERREGDPAMRRKERRFTQRIWQLSSSLFM